MTVPKSKWSVKIFLNQNFSFFVDRERFSVQSVLSLFGTWLRKLRKAFAVSTLPTFFGLHGFSYRKIDFGYSPDLEMSQKGFEFYIFENHEIVYQSSVNTKSFLVS